MDNILIIDDDENLAELLKSFLINLGYSVYVAFDAIEGIKQISQRKVNLVLLDVNMPVKNGWITLQQIRKTNDIPIIMLTARSHENDILYGFSLGADDYVTKPFSFAEIAARIQAVLTRVASNTSQEESLIIRGNFRMEIKTRSVFIDKKKVSLSPTEFYLLRMLMMHEGEIISAKQLVREVWGEQYASETGKVRRYIWYLRHKIEPNPKKPTYLHNEHGFGYRFSSRSANDNH